MPEYKVIERWQQDFLRLANNGMSLDMVLARCRVGKDRYFQERRLNQSFADEADQALDRTGKVLRPSMT